ncbi:STAS domain-containing protein [bacterium]
MFEITLNKNEVKLVGRLDASQVEKAKGVFEEVQSSCIVDFKDLQYISSAGLGVLLMSQKLLKDKGHNLKLVNMNDHIRDVFEWAGFNMIFEIE